MPGLGTKLFLQGDTLGADDVNGFFMSQVVTRFATTAARDSAFGDGVSIALGGSGKPLLAEGLLCYIDSSNLIQFYDGSGWQDSAQFSIGDGVVTTAKIADNAITSEKIAPGTVIASDIADGSITSAKIADGTIVNADVNASAAIALSKLANATAGQVLLGTTTTGVVTATTISGDIAVTGAGVTAISSDVIVNADVNASAAIAYSKLANATAGQVLLGATTTGVVTATTISGDIAVTGAGVTAISSGVIINTDIKSDAAIELGKLADATIAIKTDNYSLVLTDKNKFIKMESASNRTITVPLQSTVNFPEGSQIHLIRYGSGTVQVVPETNAVNLYKDPGAFLRARYSSATLLKCAATNTWILMGDLSAS